MTLFHRGRDSRISFAVKRGSRWQPLNNVAAARIDVMLDKHADDLSEDGYFTLNGLYQPLACKGELEPPRRRASDLKYLNACFIDFDCYKIGKSPGEVVGVMLDEMRLGRLPNASIFAYSGRGVWAFWLLHDSRDPKEPPRGDPRHYWGNYRLWSAIQSELVHRLADLGADQNACDAVRVARIPCSINSRTGTQVRYLLHRDSAGQPFTYTLETLSEGLGISRDHRKEIMSVELARRSARKENADREMSERGRKGSEALAQRRLSQFLKLRELRGSFGEGHRHYACLLFAKLLKRAGCPPSLIWQHVQQLANECAPPFPANEVRAAMNAPTVTRFSDETFYRWLDVTPDESAILDGTGVTKSGSREGMQKDRFERMERALDGRRSVPYASEMASIIAVNRDTVTRDYQRLGISRLTPVNVALRRLRRESSS